MIVCPRCASALLDRSGTLHCQSCSYQADRSNGIVLFEPGVLADHEDYKSEGLDGLYRFERGHPWFRHRVAVILDAFRRHVRKDEQVLEVGAGTGHTARALIGDGYTDFSVGELHLNGLVYARDYGLDKLYQFDLRTPPFREHFDVVAMFDVLEHIAEDEVALRKIREMLRPDGRVVLTVPAHRWLWSRIDELSSHHRRYDRHGMSKLLASCGFEVDECRYFFTALVPGLLLRKVLSRNATWENVASDAGLEISRLGSLVMNLACGVGDRLLSPLRRFVGGSLLVVGRKAPDA